MKSVLFIAGTRPEAIKIAPVLLEARRRGALRPLLCVTAQHRGMLDQALAVFGIEPDYDLDLMAPGQNLAQLTARLFSSLPGVLAQARPDAVVVQGDTTSAFAGAMSAFYERVPVAHIEAGLRTGDIYSPFPEEANRRLIGVMTRWHFAATETARGNLLGEGTPAERIFVTGNTVIDALLRATSRTSAPPAGPRSPQGRKLILVTGHRRESFGPGIENLCRALAEIARRHPEAHILYPVHPNPNVLEPVRRLLGGLENVELVEPQGYLEFSALLKECHFVITDSGGVQEEAPTFGKPVLVTRDVTERPEAVAAGCSMLVGTDFERITTEASRLLTDPAAYDRMARPANPYGDGRASERILDVLERDLLA